MLDIISRVRSQSKDEIVDIDLVMMDREFDSESVKDTCEEHGVHYLNPTRFAFTSCPPCLETASGCSISSTIDRSIWRRHG